MYTTPPAAPGISLPLLPVTHHSKQVSKEVYTLDSSTVTRTYTRDALGRVTSITDGTFGTHTYEYNGAGELTKADSETYTYDANGNITNIGGTTLGYHATIKDKLVSVGDNTVSYASIQSLNPSAWNGRHYWYEGRRLTRFTYNNLDYGYAYNDQGLRIWKCQSVEEQDGRISENYTEFFYDGDRLVRQTHSGGSLDFLYDETGGLFGFIKDNTNMYFYVKDCNENILGIIDSTGNLIVKYEYSGFGRCTISEDSDQTIANLNPIRFKGYYYDTESDMYYCQSRYYVPVWGRWLNTDSPAFLKVTSLSELNLFAYCAGDPVNYLDPSGHAIISMLLGLLLFGSIGACVGAITYTVGEAISYAITGQWEWSPWEFVGNIVGGALGGMLSFTGVGTFFSSLVDGFVSTSVSMGLQNLHGDNNHSIADIFTISTINALFDAGTSLLGDVIPIQKVNKGRNSWKSIGKSIATKYLRGSIRKVSVKTASKILGSELITSISGTIFDVLNNVKNLSEQLNESLQKMF